MWGGGLGLHPLLVYSAFQNAYPYNPAIPAVGRCLVLASGHGLATFLRRIAWAPNSREKERKSKRGEMPKRAPRKQRVADSAQLDSGGQQAARREAWCASLSGVCACATHSTCVQILLGVASSLQWRSRFQEGLATVPQASQILSHLALQARRHLFHPPRRCSCSWLF